MGIQEQGWFMNIIRSIFCFLDGIVYGLIKWILFGIFDLANITTNSEVFNGVYSRIYVILGIFMAFKLSFSFFQYIIDPESISGKSEKSLSKVFSRVFVMLAALIFLPMVLFGQNGNEGLLSRAQRAFLPTLPKLMFGVDSLGGLSNSSGVGTGENFSESIEQAADDISVTILSGFFAPPEDLDNYCDDGTYENTPPIKSMDDFRANVNLDCPKRGDILAHVDFTGVASTAGLAAKYYKYSYMWFISTIVGVLVALLLLSVTLDIAKRIFKLMILEVIAPIPIMSLIDPKGSKDGAFRKWVSSLTSTFLDIFFKLGMVYLVIVFIHLIVNSGSDGGIFKNFPTNTGFRSTYLTILLVLGLILFAKEAPKFIKEAMGFKDKGGGLFDDVKTVGKAAGLVGGAAVGTAGVLGSTYTNYKASKEENAELHPNQKGLNVLRNIGSGVAGAIGGAAVGAKALTGKNAGIKSVMDAQSKRNATRAAHSTLLGRLGSNVYGTITGQGLSEKGNSTLKNNQDAFKAFKEYKSTLETEALKQSDLYGTVSKGVNTGKTFNYEALNAALERARGSGADTFNYNDGVNSYTGLSTDSFDANVMNDVKSSQASNFADKLLSNEAFRASNGTAYNSYLSAAAAARNAVDKDGKAIAFDGKYKSTKSAIGATASATTQAQSDMKYQMRRANDRNKK